MKEKIEKLKEHGYFEVDWDWIENYVEKDSQKRGNTKWDFSRRLKRYKEQYEDKNFILERSFDEGEIVIFYSSDYVKNNSIEKLISIPIWLEDSSQDKQTPSWLEYENPDK